MINTEKLSQSPPDGVVVVQGMTPKQAAELMSNMKAAAGRVPCNIMMVLDGAETASFDFTFERKHHQVVISKTLKIRSRHILLFVHWICKRLGLVCHQERMVLEGVCPRGNLNDNHS